MSCVGSYPAKIITAVQAAMLALFKINTKTEHIKIIAGVIGSGKSTIIKFLGGHEESKIQHLNENCDLRAATALLKMDYENNDLVILEEFHRLDEAFCQFLPDLIRFLESRIDILPALKPTACRLQAGRTGIPTVVQATA